MKNNSLEKMHELKIANKTFKSSLILGTGKYKTYKDAATSIKTSETEIITVAIRHAYNQKESLIPVLNSNNIWLLPNTAGSKNSHEAIRMAYLGQELTHKVGQIDNSFIKLEVIPDTDYLLPDPIGTLKAAEYLSKKGFQVLAYTNTDPILAKQLEQVGCAAVMPLASPIGSGRGIQDPFNLSIIIKNALVPVIIDAGIGTASEASLSMEMGADGVLVNTAIARASSPELMAQAMKLAVWSGRYAYIAGRMTQQNYANPSSPLTGLPK
uniref:Thiazole synthase n=1 Tax=Neogoniolithon spectabile TaxID=231755 RepID=A0A3G3MH33_9FLOR|nr:thiamin biosynthesis protein G [Neogoniolithon spectabile]AYR06140.1 thiamin biosynthesis protein G [Neogoniolithon spectabile]